MSPYCTSKESLEFSFSVWLLSGFRTSYRALSIGVQFPFPLEGNKEIFRCEFHSSSLRFFFLNWLFEFRFTSAPWHPVAIGSSSVAKVKAISLLSVINLPPVSFSDDSDFFFVTSKKRSSLYLCSSCSPFHSTVTVKPLGQLQ